MAEQKNSGVGPDRNIAYCRIFPGIGIARVGNSDEEPFIGPEVPGVIVEPENGYKDSDGRVRKQAARFRLYAFAADGTNLGELTSDNAEIKWYLQLANKKANWWQFQGTAHVQQILDETEITCGKQQRNPTVHGKRRDELEISTERVSVSGPNDVSEDMTGTFLDYGSQVVLGKCRCDDKGRLMVTGGNGLSDTIRGRDVAYLWSYANNDWWFDDVADGPVEATVCVDGKSVEVRGRAWVVVAPPDFSPFTQNVVPLYDVVLEKALELDLPWCEGELGRQPDSTKVSFLYDIYPILRRTSDYRWVSERAYRSHGSNRVADFVTFARLQELADREAASKPGSIHSRIFAHVRNPHLSDSSLEAQNQANLSFMPGLSGDEGTMRGGRPQTFLKLTKRQYDMLKRWSQGDFKNDLPKSEQKLRDSDNRVWDLSDLDCDEQPMALIRAALEACEGGAFFPGIEITSIVRRKDFYSEAFRVSKGTNPGDLTKWMALPWQADFNDCADNWWPATRPDDVIDEFYYEDILREFPDQVQNGGVSQFLTRREKWAKGVGVRYAGFKLDTPPGLPEPLPGMTAEKYKEYAESMLARFMSFFKIAIPKWREGELEDSYRRRVHNFVSRTIGSTGFTIEEGPLTKVPNQIMKHVQSKAQLGKPKGTLAEYVAAERAKSRENTVMQGLFEIAWRGLNSVADKNEMVDVWSQLGFVAKRSTGFGETVLVQTGRPKYALRPWRELFYCLMNIESYPDFMDTARELAGEFLSSAREIMRNPSADPLRAFFEYSVTALDARLEAIYEQNRQRSASYDPVTDPGLFNTEERIIERIRQLSPFNQLDGGWLQRVTPPGNANRLQGLLFQIWSDELGNGDPAQNHANIYVDLMRSAGIYYPPVKTQEYSEIPEIWDDSFSGPVYHTAISLFPESYFPELLGMTLYLEWEANDLKRMVDLYEYFGYPSLFYKLHVAIDNTVDGHGAYAKRIVQLYLDGIRKESGETGVQRHWERIWTGYTAFRTGGTQRFTYHLNNPASPRERVVAMMERKRHYGALNHHDKRLGPARINALFYEPSTFLLELEGSDHIIPGDPDNSPFMKYLEPDGAMFRIFTKEEIEIWRDWIRSLIPPPDGSALDSGRAVVHLLRRLAARGVSAGAHGTYLLTGNVPQKLVDEDGEDSTTVCKPVTWWFQLLRRAPAPGRPPDDHARLFMKALRDSKNGWIVPYNAGQSRFVAELLGDGAMGEALRRSRPVLGNVRGADIMVRWINEGCPEPELKTERPVEIAAVQDSTLEKCVVTGKAGEAEDQTQMTAVSDAVEAMLSRVAGFANESSGNRLRRYEEVQGCGPAMGSVH